PQSVHSDGAIQPTQLAGHRSQVLRDDELPLQRLYACEQEWGGKIFLTQPALGETTAWTWAQAMQESRRIAAYLASQGWPAGSRIVILSKNCSWWIMADFAIWMAGFISVPIYAAIREASLLAIFQQSQPVACFLGSLDQEISTFSNDAEGSVRSIQLILFPNAAKVPMARAPVQWNKLIEQPPLIENPTRAWDEVATIIYTSGTTGNPKGVIHSFQAISLMAKSVLPALPPAEEEGARTLSYLPLAHIAERAIVEATALFTPLHIFFVESQQTFLRDLQQARPTIFFTIPRLLTRFQQGVFEKISARKLEYLLRIPVVRRLIQKRVLRGLGLDTVHLAASGAAPLRVELLQWYRRLGLNLVEGYGMTETGITHVPLPGHLRAGYVGNASEYAKTRISNEGEVQILGPMNFLGYFGNPEGTAESFTGDGYFRTGDRGEIDEQGRLRIVGRLKEEFKTSKAKYVIPAQIEQALTASTLFDSVCVLGSGMAGPFALVVLAAGATAERVSRPTRDAVEEQLRKELASVNATLEHHEQLRFLVISDEPWTTANGFLTPTLKIRRTMIEDHYGSYFDQWENSGKKIIWLGDV
ncbi:MAG: AMP-binding protein, partial [Acidobacteriaceae bacterium]